MNENGFEKSPTELSEEARTQLSDIRSHLSNERTHLSFLRTGVALISFGVTLNRFSLYLLQVDRTSQSEGRAFLRDAGNVGIVIVVLGCALLFWSIYHFIKTAKAIDHRDFKPSRWSILIFTFTVAGIGTIATFWMIRG